nr:restriction endonuclease subunit S [Ezakiella coagulans]
MTPQELKNSILQRAIEGKLVEQRAKEGSGEELYKVIQAEKKKLIKEGKIKKQKALPEITDEEIPFEIPENWKWVRLDEIANISAGGTPNRTNLSYWDGGIPWVKIADMKSKYISETAETISQKGLDNSSAKIFSKGTLLYSIFASIGTVGILTIDASTNQAIAGINFYGNINLDYMYYVMLRLRFILLSQARGMAQLNINQAILKNTTIPLPPLNEQKRIVEKIEELMPLVEAYEESWKRLEELNKKFPEDMKKSLLQEAIKGKLVEQRAEEGTGEELYETIQAEKKKLIKEGKIKKQKSLPEIAEEEIPFEIPENWKWVRLPEIAATSLGKTLNKSKDNGYLKPYLCSINVYWDGINLETVKEAKFSENDIIKYRLQKGDLLVCEGGDVGRSAVWNLDYEMYYQNALHNIRLIGELYPYFYKYCLELYNTNGIINKVSKGVTIKHLVQSSLHSIVFPLPPLNEQKRIVERLEELLPLCDQLMTKAE